mmetsp:Transcript_135268/g.320626  ORF Transcript_135268/g.320626 Transcript_135268/m.320626 type:complete len:803 (+) Transcript_135268:98-2506(+)
MNRSISGPSLSAGKSNLGSSLSQNASTIDLSTVDRESLPLGVTRLYGKRMKLDVRSNPAMIDLRMNYRNLLNEFKVHHGKIVSNQFVLMKPRPKAALNKPKALEYPEGVNKALFRKVAQMRAKAKEEGGPLSPKSARSGNDDLLPVEEDVDEDGSPRSKPDPTLQKEVREIARNAKVQATHSSMEYPPNSGNGLPIDRLPRALEALSYLSPDPKCIEDSLTTLLYRSSMDQPLALDEFAVVIHHFEVHRAQQIKAQFEQLDEDGSGSIDKSELRRLLWDTGYSVNRETLDEIFEEVDRDRSGTVELREFELVLKIVYDRFGFSRSEVKAFYTLFDRYDADLSGELSADELAGALGWCGHPTSIAEARDIIERYLEKSIQSISRPEFLRIMRCVAEEEIEEFRALFAAMDDDDSGFLDMQELSELFFKLGYTIHHSVIEEAVASLFPAGADDGIIFEDCVHVLAYIRSNEGFSKDEALELKSVFRKFTSKGRDELREFELTRALSWLGYPLSTQRRRQLWCRVDLDKSGAIHEGEFLKLVRHLREEETSASQILVAKLQHANSGPEIPEADFKQMLNKLGYSPSPAILAEALELPSDSTGDGQSDIYGILGILRFLRESQVKKLRQSAGLSDQQVAKIRSKFGLKLEAGKRVEPQEFERFMYDLFKSAKQTQAAQQKIQELIQENLVEGSLGLAEMFWVVRLYDDARSEEAWAKEGHIIKEAGFTSAQVAQFREQFVKADTDGSGWLNDTQVGDIFKGMKLSLEQSAVLNEALEDAPASKEAMDFAGFLRLVGVIAKKGKLVL